MIHTFIVQVAKRDDLPDSTINSAYVRQLLTEGMWLDVIDIDELPTTSLITTTKGDSQ